MNGDPFVFFTGETIYLEIDDVDGVLSAVTDVTLRLRKYANSRRQLTGSEPEAASFAGVPRAGGWTAQRLPGASPAIGPGVYACAVWGVFAPGDARVLAICDIQVVAA